MGFLKIEKVFLNEFDDWILAEWYKNEREKMEPKEYQSITVEEVEQDFDVFYVP